MPKSIPVFDVPSFTPWVAFGSNQPEPTEKWMSTYPRPPELEGTEPYVQVVLSSTSVLILPGRGVIRSGEGPEPVGVPVAGAVSVRVPPAVQCRSVLFGPPELLRRAGDALWATIPAAIVIDENGWYEYWLRDVKVREPFGSDQLPVSVPVYSRFLDGSQHRGAYRRYFGTLRMPNDVRVDRVEFSRGLGYRLKGHSGAHPTEGFVKLPKPQAEWEAEKELLPGTEDAPIDYGFGRVAWRTLTPRFAWRPGSNGENQFIHVYGGSGGGLVYYADNVAMNVSEFRVPHGVLRPGRTYVLRVGCENWRGYVMTGTAFDTAPDAIEDGPDEHVPIASVIVPR